MTLEEMERVGGVPVAKIVQGLGLPANTPTNERLGRLRRAYGFEIEQVQGVVKTARSSQLTPGSSSH